MSKKETREKNSNKTKETVLILIIILLIIIIIILLLRNLLKKSEYKDAISTDVGIIEITENDVDWDLLEELNIFNSPTIAPGDSGTYCFKIKNTTNKELIYDIQLREINENNINMNYKIKDGESYVLGNEKEGVRVEKTNVENIIAEPFETKEYVLEWKWEDSNSDTEISNIKNAQYTIRVKIGIEDHNS